MRERSEQILKIVCLVLAAFVAFELVNIGLRINPLAHVTIPALPSLPADTNAVAPGTNAPRAAASAEKGTNSLQLTGGTNVAVPAAVAGTNTASSNRVALTRSGPGAEPAKADANSATAMTLAGTNAPAPVNLASTGTNPVAPPKSNKKGTNAVLLASLAEPQTNGTPAESGTNDMVTTTVAGTNAVLVRTSTGTNAISHEELAKLDTNAIASKGRAKKNAGPASGPDVAMAMAGMNPRQMGPGKAPELPPEIQARVARISDSEILGPVMRPMPMALLGIAGNVAFLRSPSGQTGLVKEGDNLGEIKLLRIGTNRVLIEQDGQPKELMIFSGFGGESLLPKTTESTNETKHP